MKISDRRDRNGHAGENPSGESRATSPRELFQFIPTGRIYPVKTLAHSLRGSQRAKKIPPSRVRTTENGSLRPANATTPAGASRYDGDWRSEEILSDPDVPAQDQNDDDSAGDYRGDPESEFERVHGSPFFSRRGSRRLEARSNRR